MNHSVRHLTAALAVGLLTTGIWGTAASATQPNNPPGKPSTTTTTEPVTTTTALSTTTTTVSDRTVNLHSPHQNSSNPGFDTGDCPNSGWGWHFVLPGNDSEFITITATFEQAGTVTTFQSFPTGKHAYIYTPTSDTLKNASATITGTADRFMLSHICTPPPEPTTTSTTSTSTTSTSTTSTSTTSTSTTTTTLPTTTTQSPTTTTPETTTQQALPVTGTNQQQLLLSALAISLGGLLLAALARHKKA